MGGRRHAFPALAFWSTVSVAISAFFFWLYSSLTNRVEEGDRTDLQGNRSFHWPGRNEFCEIAEVKPTTCSESLVRKGMALALRAPPSLCPALAAQQCPSNQARASSHGCHFVHPSRGGEWRSAAIPPAPSPCSAIPMLTQPREGCPAGGLPGSHSFLGPNLPRNRQRYQYLGRVWWALYPLSRHLLTHAD